MNILVIGSGGREHSLAWKLKQSPRVDTVFVAPGNAGTAIDAVNLPIGETDFKSLIDFAKKNNVGLTVVGPEAPLAAGIVDVFESEGLKVFGPSQKAARLEGSKIFCKEVLTKAAVPTAFYRTFDALKPANDYLWGNRETRFVIKADGLAAGKGVIVCDSHEEALEAVKRMVSGEFGSASKRFMIEERLQGEEASVLAITDGRTIMTLQPAQDHKAAGDGDRGPNTGGMGAYCPTTLVSTPMLHKVESDILVPTVHALNRMGVPFKGVLYAGLMMTRQGPKVLEYNARFGDPECQPLLMRLKTDLVDVLEAVADGQLDRCDPLVWDDRPSVCVVLASCGYPGSYEKGTVIHGLEEANAIAGVKVFHAGTTMNNGQVVTNGGRVLGVTALGETVAEAKKKAYLAVEKINWDGMWCRTDISDKESKR